jgi:hypothetical protein
MGFTEYRGSWFTLLQTAALFVAANGLLLWLAISEQLRDIGGLEFAAFLELVSLGILAYGVLTRTRPVLRFTSDGFNLQTIWKPMVTVPWTQIAEVTIQTNGVNISYEWVTVKLKAQQAATPGLASGIVTFGTLNLHIRRGDLEREFRSRALQSQRISPPPGAGWPNPSVILFS